MIRKAEIKDIPSIMNIVHDAQSYFRKNDIPQWMNGYPNEKQFEEDIQNDGSYVLEENDQIVGTFFITFKDDPYYEPIDGAWLNNNAYVTIHRIAISSNYKGNGLAKECFDYAESLAQEKGMHDLRADTHELNKSMQHALLKNGFIKCGNIFIKDHQPRIGFQKSF